MSEKLIARDFTAEDIEQVQYMHECTWGFQNPLEYWRWKYIDPPEGCKAFVMTTQEGKVVSFCGFWKREVYLSGTVFPSVILCDVMTLPDYRNLSAMNGLMEKIRAEIMYHDFFCGFPNDLSLAIFSNQFKDIKPNIGDMLGFSIPLNPAGSSRILKPFQRFIDAIYQFLFGNYVSVGRKTALTIEPAGKISPDFDLFWEKTAKEYTLIFKRDSAYLNWRYVNDPLLKHCIWKAVEGGKLVGWAVSTMTQRKGKVVGNIIDWMVPLNRPDIFKEMIRAIIISMAKSKADQVDLWLMPTASEWLRCIKPFLSIKRRRQRPFIGGGGLFWYDDKYEAQRHKIYNFDTVYLNLGDSDYIGRAV